MKSMHKLMMFVGLVLFSVAASATPLTYNWTTENVGAGSLTFDSSSVLRTPGDYNVKLTDFSYTIAGNVFDLLQHVTKSNVNVDSDGFINTINVLGSAFGIHAHLIGNLANGTSNVQAIGHNFRGTFTGPTAVPVPEPNGFGMVLGGLALMSCLVVLNKRKGHQAFSAS